MKTRIFIEDMRFLISKPGFFMVHRVKDVELVIVGYQYAIAGSENAEAVDNFMKGFRKFVNAHFMAEEDFAWPVLISLKSNDDRHSLELFGELFHKYEQSIIEEG